MKGDDFRTTRRTVWENGCMTEQMPVPDPIEVAMMRRLAARYARVLAEFGFFTAEELASANHSQAASGTAMVDNWRERGRVFAVPHPDKSAHPRDVYSAFQFEKCQPREVVRDVLKVFARKDRWKLALWFTSNNGWLPDDARPVDLLKSDPKAVVEAARRDAVGSPA